MSGPYLPVHLPNGRIIHGEQRDGAVWIWMGRTQVDVEATARLFGLRPQWVPTASGPRLEVMFP